MYLSSRFTNELDVSIASLNSNNASELKQYIPSIADSDLLSFKVEKGELIYVGNEYKKYDWARQEE